jgi:hypothetical protein
MLLSDAKTERDQPGRSHCAFLHSLGRNQLFGARRRMTAPGATRTFHNVHCPVLWNGKRTLRKPTQQAPRASKKAGRRTGQ